MTANEPLPLPSQWLKITCFCPVALLDAATDLFAILSGTGVEQSPETDGGAVISGFFPLTATAGANDQTDAIQQVIAQVAAQLDELFSLYGKPAPSLTTALLADEDWATSWQQFFKPFEIIPGLVIKPSWEEYAPQPDQQVIEMDPGMAFGTGQHASTRMALALIRESMEHAHGSRVLDVGTGTGILAMAAILLGAKRAVAIDNDPEAVRVAGENIGKNGLLDRIAVSTTAVEQVEGTYPLVIANIVHDVLVDMAPTLTLLTAPCGSLVLAGILQGTQEENIIRLYTGRGFCLRTTLHEEEWAALRFQRC